MELTGSPQSLDCRDIVALVHHGERKTGIDTLATDMHGAGAALPMIATLFCPGEVQMFAQQVEKRRPVVNVKLMPLAIDGE
jgi:hypothetical protein